MAMSFVLNRLWCGHAGTVVFANSPVRSKAQVTIVQFYMLPVYLCGFPPTSPKHTGM